MVADNFDADISSQNGKLSTHSLAPVLTQKEQDDMSPDQQETIKHIKKSEMSKSVERFNGQKNPELLQDTARKYVRLLKVLAQ